MKTHAMPKALLALLLATALLLGTVPTGLAEGVRAVVAAASAKVYAVPAPHRYMGALKQGTEVTVEQYNASVALISCMGQRGLVAVKDLKKIEEATAQPEAAAPAVATQAARSVIAICDTRAYARPSTASASLAIQAGTSLNLLAVSGSVAMVERGGRTGYMLLSHLGEPGSAIQQAAAPQAEATPTITWNKAVVTNQATRIYRAASTSSAYWNVGQGLQLTLLASKGNIAQVSRNGVVGYMALTHLSEAAQTAEAAPAQPVETVETVASDAATDFLSGGSNKDVIYAFLISKMGYNPAAAAGVLSNIKYESNYNPNDVGDNGTSYGITQWHAGRMTALINWCTSNGMDYTTLTAQLWYLKYELENKYTKVHNYLKSVDNSAQGAYDAAYYFCYYYEVPANKASRADTRGKYARDTLYKA